ncbi:LOW QUALITY PROTEIN: transcription factor GTE7 [Arabidopsis lyrata subsp. lyrata]|uniref:LOW QUALITY PROTEIN: transcription factor GTE7 n=1 Tax=Arabidopsis lyrata subsp. lyrata TaxID=81972 RepID=UPI000A29E6EA|nr:LOW QUALITY PROTEIN: transcription factor GTE7 [Arabidopsis lyrata subsp. lyrata]|eukprot:XP_020873364.1 LOW QUALITY PROTEIN: transcription factor GTE7 [Arabidopsis lyrata subsp. lyrata]
MAPAVLGTLNEPSYQEQCGAVFMRKFTNQSVTENTNNLPLFNPNPNPNFDRSNSSKQFDDSSEFGSYATFNIAGYTSNQLRELKKRFTSELEQIRILRERIESGTFETQQAYTIPEVPAVRSAPLNSFAGEKNDLGPKKKKQKKNVSGLKRSNQFTDSDPESEKLLAGMLNTCGQILVKLMKHKWAWVFNTPVDVVGLGLHDYHQVVKKPMDLGTVKLNLDKGFYVSPIDFATDVRLTFNNAMTYNPKGQDVYFMADKLLDHFDGMFNPAFKKFEAQQLKLTGSSSRLEPEVKQRHWNQNSPMVANPRKGTEQISIAKKLDSVKPPLPALPPQLVEPSRVQSPSPPPPPPPPVVEPQLPQLVIEVEAPPDVSDVTKGRKGKLPKPKAKDPNKRLMTIEQKSKLGMNLQDLPPEKLGQLVQILRKRNGHLAQDGDEIELDIEAVDNETLWELDRFVTNYKKMASKIKRQGFIRNVSTPPRNMTSVAEMGSAEKRTRRGDAGEEDVDIGEDIPIEDYPSVEIERDGTAVAGSGSSSSGSSSSSGGSSSSSDSGSGGSSSGSDSDADSVQSPFVEAKEAQ